MPTIKKEFPLEPNLPKSIAIECNTAFGGKPKDLTVKHEGQTVATVTDSDKIKNGVTVALLDGQKLFVRLKGGLIAEIDGEPLEGSSNNPKDIVKAASYVLYFLALFNIGLGVAAEVGQVDFLLELGIGWGIIVVGVIFGLLGFGISLGSWIGFISLIVAIGLYGVDAFLTVAASASNGSVSGAGIGLRIAIIIILVRSIGSSWKLARQKKKRG